MVSRREFAASGITAAAMLLSGCSTEESQNSPSQNEAITRGERLEIEEDFSTIYQSTYDTGSNFPRGSEINRDQPIIDQIEDVLTNIILNDQETQSQKEVTEIVKEVVHNELGYSSEQVLIDNRKTGVSETYTAIFTKVDDSWRKHLAFQGILLKHGEQAEEGDSQQKQRLDGIWDEEVLDVGAATEIDAWREGVEESGTREDYDDQRWLAASIVPDVNNDSILVGYDVGTAVGDWWGKIGYTRAGIEIIDRIQDHSDNTTFNQEVKLTRRLSEYFHNAPISPYGEGLPVDKEGYIRVGRKDEIDQNVDQGIAGNPYRLTENTSGELWAATVNYEEHKKDAFNFGVPESRWPEDEYPGQVELSRDRKEHDLWVWDENNIGR